MIVLTRVKGAVMINKNEVVECGIRQGLKIDLTGVGDLFVKDFYTVM